MCMCIYLGYGKITMFNDEDTNKKLIMNLIRFRGEQGAITHNPAMYTLKKSIAKNYSFYPQPEAND